MTDKNNYRSVSVLSVISKLFEKVTIDQLNASFAPTFSKTLIKLPDDWRSTLDEKKDVGVVAIDLSKAFDCIWHNLLIAKLEAYG